MYTVHVTYQIPDTLDGFVSILCFDDAHRNLLKHSIQAQGLLHIYNCMKTKQAHTKLLINICWDMTTPA